MKTTENKDRHRIYSRVCSRLKQTTVRRIMKTMITLLPLLLVAGNSASVLAQKTKVFALAPREATRPLKIAEKAIENGNFDEATTLLGELLSTPELNQYLIQPSQSEKRGRDKQIQREVSLRQEAEKLLGEIPADARTSYEERFGVRAKAMLRNAIEQNDADAIAMTSRLYFHTRAGLEATMLVGHTNLAQGRPAMAAVAFEKVAAQPEGRDRFDPEATLLAAVSWSLNGSANRAEKLLTDLKQRHDGSVVLFYGKEVELFGDNTPVQTWLKEIVASTPLQSHPIVNQWLVFRGDAQRNAESGDGFPLLSPRWSIRTVADPNDEEGIQEFQQKLIKNKISPIPKVHPLAIDETLVIRTDDRMYGVDAKSGKRIWSYPPADVFRSPSQRSNDQAERPSKKLHQDKLRERLWLDALYGQISSDGDSIFVVPNPGISTDRDDWRSYQTQVYDEPTDLRLYNELKSLDLKQQGALQWQVGGETGLDEPKLAKAFFLGAPLPVGDRLYAICLQEESVNLVVLESETGKLAWTRTLASTEETVSFREDRLRRLAGATPSETNGILICPTGLNAIVAVDLATQSLSWGFQFKEPQRKRVDRLTDQLSKWDSMWRDATVTLTGGAVIYTPIDSDEVYCLDLQTGESLWNDPKRRAKYKAMHVETIRNGQIILTSADRLKGVELDTGKVSWTFRLGDYGLVSGRGYVSGDHCYIPTTTKKVLRINAATGEVDGVAMTEKVLGNLISFRGDVISHGADHLTAYPRDEPSRLLLAETLDQQPTDHSLLSIKAQLNLLDGQYAESVDAISQAYDIFPNSSYAKVLVQALTQLIDVDFEKAEQVSNRYQNLFKKQDLQRLLRGKVTGLINLDRWDEAFETLIEIAETVELTSPTTDTAGQRIEDDTSVTLLASSVDQMESLAKNSANSELTMRLKQWLRWKFGEVYENIDQRKKENFREVISQHLKKFAARESLPIRHQRMRLFPSNALNENSRIALAAELYEGKLYTQAAGMVGNLLSADEQQEEGEGKKKEDKTLHDSTSERLAKRLLQRMINLDFPDDQIDTMEGVVADIGKVEATDRDILDADFYALPTDSSKSPQRLRTDELNVQWNRDVKRIDQESEIDYLYIGTQHFCDVVASDEPLLKTLVFTYSDEFREFKMHDRLGRFVEKIYLDPDGKLQGTRQGTKGQIFLHKSLMLLCLDREMFALDWDKFVRGQPALLWSATDVTPTSRGIASDTLDGVCVLSDGMLKCLSPFTGEVLWQRTRVSSRATLLEGSESLTVWNRSERSYDKVDPTVGRLMVSGKIAGRGAASLTSGDLQLFVENQRVERDSEEEDDDDAPDTVFEIERQVFDQVEFTMFDFNQQEILWTKTLPYPTHSTLVDQDNFLTLSNDGVFSMIDIKSGEVKFETKVPQLQNVAVSGITTQRIKGSHLVSVHSITQPSDYLKQDDMRVAFKRMHKANAMLNGHLVLLDAKSGESKWKLPVVVQQFQLLEGIPWDSPFLFLFRSNTYESGIIQVRVQVAMLDVASGKLKANELFKVPIRDEFFYHIACLPKFSDQIGQTIELQIATLQARFILEDHQRAPQPVAALTNASSFKRMKEEIATTIATPPLVTDLQPLIDNADAAEKRQAELQNEEVRLTEIEMQKK